MKKASLYIASLAACAMVFTACDDTTDGGVMQVNPQLPEITASQFQINPGTVLSSGEVSLDSWSTSGYEIPMLNIQYTGEEPLPEGTLYDFEMQVSDNPDFTNPRSVAVTSTDNVTFMADAQSWDNAFRSLLGKAPDAKPNYVRFAAYVTWAASAAA
ncbi:MAG: hypothetical protein K1V71_03280 [Paramuribaculum sp.]